MKVKELIKALQSLEDDEYTKAEDCDVMIYPDKSFSLEDKDEVVAMLVDFECIIDRVERDPDNAAPEVTLYFKLQ